MVEMDQMLKNELGFSKKAKTWIVLGLLGLFFASAFFCYRLFFNTKETVRAQAIRNISNISQLNKDSLTRAIVNRRTMLEIVSTRLESKRLEDVGEILDYLEEYRSANNFYSIGVITQDKILYLSNGKEADVSDTEFGTVCWDGDFHLSASYRPYAGGQYRTNAFTYPVYYDGELRFVLLATYLSKNLTERMNFSSMEGKGFNFIVNSRGEVVIFPNFYKNQRYNELMQYISDTPELVAEASQNQYFKYKGERYYAHFEDLEISDWMLMTCAREDDAFAEAYALTRNAFLELALLWAVTMTAILFIAVYSHHSGKKLSRSAFYDELLGIGNSNAFSVCFRKIPEETLARMYLVVFDVDKFKEFNYIYGNEEGDRLLRYIVQVFHEVVPQVYLFRSTSDVFITLEECSSQEELTRNIQRVVERYWRDIREGLVHPFDTSAGIRKIELGVPLQQLISDAIIARDSVKGNHLRHHALYDEVIRDKRLEYMEMESEFFTALRNGEFQVYYQPKYNMFTREIVGAEALARWIKPDGTIISPGRFIPCFEASSQITMLDEEILRQVCRQMKEMREEGIWVKPVSVNLSRVHLQHPGILTKISEIIKESGIKPKNLSFEITESAVCEDKIPLDSILDCLHSLGCKVEMDDYGVGVSGPKDLASKDFDVVKLDKSFVDDLGDKRVEDVIYSTVYMAKKWGMSVLVEGVEDFNQVKRLMRLGCVLAQGYYFSRPLPLDEYKKLLRSSKQEAGSADMQIER